MKLLGILFFAALGCAADHAMLPDATLTPGATDARVTQANVKNTICKPGYTSKVRSVSAAQKREVMTRYSLPTSDLKLVEIDHFISLELGGSNDIANLWPQYYAPAPGQVGYLGAREKDTVETSLHRDICKGKTTLAEAQTAIRSWPEVYREKSR
jgi:hypothetical protein